jgi:NitT/TauT family transport system ATP-binding protein
VIRADPIIRLAGVTKSFGKPEQGAGFTAVDRLPLAVERRHMLALLGKTGCGKSTIFNMIAGLTEPTSGTVTVEGLDPLPMPTSCSATSRFRHLTR